MQLLQRKGIAFREYDIWAEETRQEEMIRRAGGRTTAPQAFVGGRHIGDASELAALEAAGRLDAVLRGATLENGTAGNEAEMP